MPSSRAAATQHVAARQGQGGADAQGIYPALGTTTFTDWNNPLPYHTATHTISLAAWPGLQ